MSEKLDQLREIIGEVADLNAVMSLVGWDQQTLCRQDVLQRQRCQHY